MSTAASEEEEEAQRAYAIVGELILIASALDNQLNRICISALSLTESPMLEPVVASLDSARKIEILKAYASNLTAMDWKKGLKAHAEAVEVVNRARNIAAHSVMSFRDGKITLHSPAAAKLLKSIDIASKTADRVDIQELAAAIKNGEVALGSGIDLLGKLERVAAEIAARRISSA
jgi:hypothetical protein